MVVVVMVREELVVVMKISVRPWLGAGSGDGIDGSGGVGFNVNV